MTDRLAALLGEELDRNPADLAKPIAEAIVARHGGTVAAVLFYGSCLRTGDEGGILDLYVLTDDLKAFRGGRAAAVLDAVLPPSVSYVEVPFGVGALRAKVALMSTAAFARAAGGRGFDTGIWARFCQPTALAYARDQASRDFVIHALATAVTTASTWAVRLGPVSATPGAYWKTLFRHTYGAELRAETGDRADLVYAWAAERYDRLLPEGLLRGGVPFERGPGGSIRPLVLDRDGARRAWSLRRPAIKLLNVLRLAKASFTFENGVDYILWKLERHSGKPARVSDWERRHPLLAAPGVLWRLYRDGTIR